MTKKLGSMLRKSSSRVFVTPPYWAGPSGNLITMEDNAAASGWWEEVLAFFCKPPVSDLFVGETCFDGKDF